VRGKGGEGGKGGGREMTQTLYVHMNKIKKKDYSYSIQLPVQMCNSLENSLENQQMVLPFCQYHK
jgi:hypothetical protein